MSLPVLVVLIRLALAGPPDQSPAPSTTAAPASVCLQEGGKLVGSQPVAARGKLHLPKKRKHVQPSIPSLPPGTSTTAIGNVWIGEALIDTKGRTVHVWSLREPKLTPPLAGVTDAITAAVQQWEYEPLLIDKTARPFCKIVTFTIDWE
jgi:hypothetical protein